MRPTILDTDLDAFRNRLARDRFMGERLFDQFPLFVRSHFGFVSDAAILAVLKVNHILPWGFVVA